MLELRASSPLPISLYNEQMQSTRNTNNLNCKPIVSYPPLDCHTIPPPNEYAKLIKIYPWLWLWNQIKSSAVPLIATVTATAMFLGNISPSCDAPWMCRTRKNQPAKHRREGCARAMTIKKHSALCYPDKDEDEIGPDETNNAIVLWAPHNNYTCIIVETAFCLARPQTPIPHSNEYLYLAKRSRFSAAHAINTLRKCSSCS